MTRLRSPPPSVTRAQRDAADGAPNEQAADEIMSLVGRQPSPAGERPATVISTMDPDSATHSRLTNPASWTTSWINRLSRNEITPILRAANVEPRPPFLGDYDTARVADQRRAMRIYAGIDAEFRVGDTVAFTDGDDVHPACIVVGVKDSLPGRPKLYDIRIHDGLTLRSPVSRAIKESVLGADLVLRTDTADPDTTTAAGTASPFQGVLGAGVGSAHSVDAVNADEPVVVGEDAGAWAAAARSVTAPLGSLERVVRPDTTSDGVTEISTDTTDNTADSTASTEHSRRDRPPVDEPRAQRHRPGPRKLVLSGGPCGLKSRALEMLAEELPRHGIAAVVAVREVATAFMSTLPSDFDPAALPDEEQDRFQRSLFAEQLAAERQAEVRASFTPGAVIVVDRGLFDYKAFCRTEELWQQLVGTIPADNMPYDHCLFMRSVAVDKQGAFERVSNPRRVHDARQSADLDAVLLRSWQSTGVSMDIIDNSTGVQGKLSRALSAALLALGKPPPHGMSLSIGRHRVDTADTTTNNTANTEHSRRERPPADARMCVQCGSREVFVDPVSRKRHAYCSKRCARAWMVAKDIELGGDGEWVADPQGVATHGQQHQPSQPQQPPQQPPTQSSQRSSRQSSEQPSQRQRSPQPQRLPSPQPQPWSQQQRRPLQPVQQPGQERFQHDSRSQFQAMSEHARFVQRFPNLNSGAPSSGTVHQLQTAADVGSGGSPPQGLPPQAWSSSNICSGQPTLGSTQSLGAGLVGGASSGASPSAQPHQRWYLTSEVSGPVMPKHCRSLRDSPLPAPAATAFTVTAAGVATVAATTASVEPIGTLDEFFTCERWWSIYVKQFEPQFFVHHGGEDTYAFYLQEIRKLAGMFGVPAAMMYDEGMRKAVFSGRDSRNIAVTSFGDFDIKLHQECFFLSRMATLSNAPGTGGAEQGGDGNGSSGVGGGSGPGAGKKGRGSAKDLSQNCRRAGEKQVCFNFNLGRCSDSSCKFAHVCTACGGSHAERPKGLQGKRCRKRPAVAVSESSAPAAGAATTSNDAAAGAATGAP